MSAAARPFVTANFAITADGRVSTRALTPVDFSSPRDKRRLVEIRAGCDAILASARTIGTDNMSMGLPAPELRAERIAKGLPPFPLRVLLSNRGRIDPALRIFTKTFSPIVIFATEKMPQRTRAALAGKATLHLDDNVQVDLARMFRTLCAEYRVRRLVCEGGPQILRALLTEQLIDELHVTVCPRIFGGAKALTLTGLAGTFLPRSVALELRDMEVIGDECYLRYRVAGR
jgi:riboflavin-specific deaminase-like protein